jgi:two-component system, sporulation sensor kinase D
MADSTRSSQSGAPPEPEWLVNQIAHTLRNPIFAALVQSEALLVRAGDDEKVTRAVQLVRRQLKRLESEINEMLLYGRPTRLQPRQFELTSVIEQIAERFRRGEYEHSAVVELVQQDDHLVVSLDPDAVKIILERLITNAIEHTEAPHALRLELATRGDGMIHITVSDQGEGIPDNVQKDMFLPFYPQHSGRAGLGLSVASKFAHAQGGHIEIESTEGEGTVARVVIPIEAPKAAANE